MARASSGSRSSIRSIEPLMSANRKVTTLRSPSRFSGVGASVSRIWVWSDFFAEAAGDANAAPQCPQNLATGAFSKPHEAHGVLNGVPHSLQNFSPSGFSVLHFAQSTCRFLLYA